MEMDQQKVGTINGENKIFQSISKDLFVSFLQTSYRTYIHLYINISVRKRDESVFYMSVNDGVRNCCKNGHREGRWTGPTAGCIHLLRL